MKIFASFPLSILLQRFCPVCKLFNRVIHTYDSLWCHFEFNYYIQMDQKTFISVMKRAPSFRRFIIPEAIVHHAIYETDHLMLNMCNARNLTWLDVTAAPLSKLTFLCHLKKLEVLILDSCTNICPNDVGLIKQLSNLQHLYIGYTGIPAQAIMQSVPCNLHTLECSGIQFTLGEAEELLRIYNRQFLFLTISLRPHNSARDIQELRSTYPSTTITYVQSH